MDERQQVADSVFAMVNEFGINRVREVRAYLRGVEEREANDDRDWMWLFLEGFKPVKEWTVEDLVNDALERADCYEEDADRKEAVDGLLSAMWDHLKAEA